MLPGHHAFKQTLQRCSSAAEGRRPNTASRRKRRPNPVEVKPFSSSSRLLKSSVEDVRPLAKMKRALLDERARRRRHFAATMQPVVFDAFAAVVAQPGETSLATELIPGVSGRRRGSWLEAEAIRKAAELQTAAERLEAEASALAKLRRAATFFGRGECNSSASFRAFERPARDSRLRRRIGFVRGAERTWS